MPNKKGGSAQFFIVGERDPLNATPEVLKRIAELETKVSSGAGLTQAEFDELRGLQGYSGNEAVVEIGDMQDVGVTDPDKALAYMQGSYQKADAAFREGHYLEAVSLKFAVLDLGLRMYLLKGTDKPVNAKMMFGQMVTEAEKRTQMDRALIERLRDFSDRRAAGIHRLFLGQADYGDLRDLYLGTDDLIDDLTAATALDFGA